MKCCTARPKSATICARICGQLVERKARVIEAGLQRARWRKVDPRHLFFTIWAATQTYADFEPQVCAVLGVRRMNEQQVQAAATRT